MKFTGIMKKQLSIYAAIAYGIPYLMGLLMWYGHANALDVSVFPNTQMMYPAAGAMLAILITKRGDVSIPRRFFVTFLLLTGAMGIISILSILNPTGTAWVMVVQYVLIGGSVLGWILLLTEKKEKRRAYGLSFKNGKATVVCILLFLMLYILRTGISYAISGQLALAEIILTDAKTWIGLAALFVNFFLVWIAFFGEEYGWRYYLQPILQGRFGKRWGVVILGIIWGLWHMPVNFFYYSRPDSGLISMAGQQITCITLGIFLAYAYMKTKNIWVPVILHFLNNNLIPIISLNYSSGVLQNQKLSWSSLLPALLINGILFGGFMVAKEFKKEKIKGEI